MSKSGTKWTEDEDALLKALHELGRNVVEIAQEIGRPIGGVEHRLALHGMRANAREAWRRDEEATLLDMRDRGCSWGQVGMRLRRHPDACRGKWDRLIADREKKVAEPAVVDGEPPAIKRNNAYLVACIQQAGIPLPRRGTSPRVWFMQSMDRLTRYHTARCEYDIPPDQPARTQVYFADTRSCVGSQMAMCAEVA